MSDETGQELLGVDKKTVASIRCLLAAGKLAPALVSAKKLVATKPLCAEHWLVLSEVLSHPGVPGDALIAINRAVKIVPKSSRFFCR